MSRVLAIIPAAGKGTRLGLDVPKILAPITDDSSIWDLLWRRISPLTHRVSVVMSDWGLDEFLSYTRSVGHHPIEVVVQPIPLGMGDAIFRAAHLIDECDVVLVIWGDQVNISQKTVRHALDSHAGDERTLVIPTVRVSSPYVEYQFTPDGKLARILQSREGDRCAGAGYSDAGLFVLSTGELNAEWQKYLIDAKIGESTGEVNFLPFLVHLSTQGWSVRKFNLDDPGEARGVNTQADLEFARARETARHQTHNDPVK